MATHCTCLNFGHLIVWIDPGDAIHLGHVDGNDESRFIVRTQERVGDVGASTVGNQADVVLERG